jgi:restriction endonuclease S subunit
MIRIRQSNNPFINANRSIQQNNYAKNNNTKNILKNDLKNTKDNDELSPEQKRHVEELKQIERKVEAHEQAHKSVGGEFAGSMSYSYTQGPDGRRYKTGGEVSISIPSDDDPEKLIAQLMQVKRAALAPSDPSPQDIKVAGIVDGKLQVARAKLREAYNQENQENEQESRLDLKI